MEDTLTALHEWLDANWDTALTRGQWWSLLAKVSTQRHD